MGGIILALIVLFLYGAGIILLCIGALIYYLVIGLNQLFTKNKSTNKSKTKTLETPAEPMAKVTEREAFEDAILEVGYLRDYNYRFPEVEDRAYELMTRYHDSESFLGDVLRECYRRKDFVSEIIWFIASMVKGGSSSDQIDQQLRPYFINPKSLAMPEFIPDQDSIVPEATLEEKPSREEELARQRKEHYEQLKLRCEAIMAKGHDLSKDELAEFKNTIYNLKFLGHENPRFIEITYKAHNIIDKYGNSLSFYDDVIAGLSKATDLESEVIAYIVKQKKSGVSDVELIKKLREKYMNHRESVATKPANTHSALKHDNHKVQYVEAELSEASKKLRAKAKIAHKHRAIQYADIIGGELAEAYKESGRSSFFEFVKEQCANMVSKGDSSLTSEDYRSRGEVIVMYKKVQSNEMRSNVDACQVVPQYVSDDKRVNSLLNILNQLTSMKLPRYETPRSAHEGDVYQREYKKTNPLEVYNDLVESEYGPRAFTDKRFSILYQLILFAVECLEIGMTEAETLAAISSLKVIRKNDLKLLREMEARYKGLSSKERKLVQESEVLGSLALTNLYINLIRHYKDTRQSITLNQYIISVLLKQYKDSQVAWSLLKYIYLANKPLSFIESHKYEIRSSLCCWDNDSSLKEMNNSYYVIDDAFAKLKDEYNSGVGMTRHNLKREGLTPEMLKPSTLNRYIPKRFDGQGRFCMMVAVTSTDIQLFTDLEKMTVGDSTYVKFPIPAMTTQDVYQLLLTCKKQMRKERSTMNLK